MPTHYEIRVKGHLSQRWSEWFDGMTIEFELEGGVKPVSTLTGLLADQSALYGVLGKIRNLGLKLLSVECVNPGPEVEKEIDNSGDMEVLR